MSESEGSDRGTRQLRRLEILTDVIYGLVVFRLFLLFPQPPGGSGPFRVSGSSSTTRRACSPSS